MKSSWKALLIVVGLVVLVASLNVIVRRGGPVRLDTTEGNVYTLTKGTRNILEKAKKSGRPVTIRFYLSNQEDVDLPAELIEYSKRVKDLLAEYSKASGGSVVVQTYTPVPNSKEEDAALLDNITRRNPLLDSPPSDSLDEIDYNQRGRAREPYFFGLSISSLQNIETIPYLDPKREANLEYELSRAISSVIRKERLKIGLLEGTDLGVSGRMGMMGGPGSQPWAIYRYLSRDFEMVSIPFDVQPMEPGDEDHPFYDLDLLLIIHPVRVNRPQPMQPGMPPMGATTVEGLSEETQYAIDQYLVNGGKAIAFLDNQYFVSRFFDFYSTILPYPRDDRNPAWYKDLLNLFDSNSWPHHRSGLDKLYDAWGVKIGGAGSGDPLVFDPRNSRPISYERPYRQFLQREFALTSQLQRIPDQAAGQTILNSLVLGKGLMADFKNESLTKDHPVTRNLSSVRMVDPSPIEGNPANGLSMRTLVRASNNSKAIDGRNAGFILSRARTLEEGVANLQSAAAKKKPYPVAVLLEGKFKSAFDADPTKKPDPEEEKPPAPPITPPLLPADAPDSLPSTPESDDADEESKDKETEPEKEEEPDHHIAAGTKEGALVLVSDVDMLFDFFMGDPERGGERNHDNVAFVLNLVETLAGDQDLVSIRGRGTTNRSFTVINDIREKAAAKASGPRKKIAAKLDEIQKKIMEGGKLVITNQGLATALDPEQAAEIEQLEEERAELEQQSRQINRDERKEIEAAINRYEWTNMLVTPTIVVLLGFAVGITRKIKTAAK